MNGYRGKLLVVCVTQQINVLRCTVLCSPKFHMILHNGHRLWWWFCTQHEIVSQPQQPQQPISTVYTVPPRVSAHHYNMYVHTHPQEVCESTSDPWPQNVWSDGGPASFLLTRQDQSQRGGRVEVFPWHRVSRNLWTLSHLCLSLTHTYTVLQLYIVKGGNYFEGENFHIFGN